MLSTLVLAVAGYQINATMLAPALPDVIERLDTTSGPAGLAQTLFFLFAAIGQVTIARLSDHVGRQRMLLATLGTLIAGEAVCALAPNIGIFVIGRMLQGVSSGTFSLAYLILHESLPPRRFGRALGIVTAVNGGIAGIDAVLGGMVADTVGFRGIFLASLLITAGATAAVFIWVPSTSAPSTGKMDWKGALLLGLGLTGVLLALNEGSSWGWGSPGTLGLLLGGLSALVLFSRVEGRTRDALIDTATLASRRVWPLLLTTVFTLAGVFGMLNFTIPLLTQSSESGYGMSATLSALLFLTPASALGIVAAPIAGHFAPRIGWRRSILIGLLGTAAAFLPLALAPRVPWVLFAALAILGVTYTGYSLTALTGLAVESAPPDKPGSLPGINGACFGIGSSLGIAVVSSVVTGITSGGPPTFEALHTALWASAGLVVLALLAALLIKPTPETGAQEVATAR
ncbi:putative MFS family arabinose efflux permease [Actinopolyspora biskrensis]|uniref:Putative MFS family arabinose efflux permease n=1 Tax=Actinopolyspora biskrensis TaxID=1470178 RepID=A0A852YRC0_9ACTN|nr:MFS transporter [Actinopolyspora biskrensis]NYH77784.1 putative MFS family arabinose efflux permease [Actinopolyspora biskrensis]